VADISAPAGQATSKLALSVILLLLTVAAAGAGLAVGMVLTSDALDIGNGKSGGMPIDQAKAPATDTPKPGDNATADPLDASEQIKLIAYPFPPVLTALAAPKSTWIRLEGSLLIAADAKDNPEILVEKAGMQILTYLHTTTLSDLEGPSGILRLRDDLNETVSALSGGQVSEVLIHSMVVE